MSIIQSCRVRDKPVEPIQFAARLCLYGFSNVCSVCVCVSNDLCEYVRKNVMWALCDFVLQGGSEAMNRNFLAHSSRYSCDV